MRSEGYRDLVSCSVNIELSNGKLMTGIVEKPRTKSLSDFFNNADHFLQFATSGGSTVLVAKSAIATCEHMTANVEP